MGRFDDRINDFMDEGRPGRLDGSDFSPQDFPFSAFEFAEYDKATIPTLRMKSPWEFSIEEGKPISASIRELDREYLPTSNHNVHIWYQSAEPASGVYYADIWIDSDDGTVYKYSDSDGAYYGTMAWRSGTQTLLMDWAGDNLTSEIYIWFQGSQPTGDNTGDLWFDTGDNGALYRWDGAAWADSTLGIEDKNDIFSHVSDHFDLSGQWDYSAVAPSGLAAYQYMQGVRLFWSISPLARSLKHFIIERAAGIDPAEGDFSEVTTTEDRMYIDKPDFDTDVNGTLQATSYTYRVKSVGWTLDESLPSNEANVTLDPSIQGVTSFDTTLESEGFSSGTDGWQILGNGSAEFNDVTVRGTVYASDGEFTGTVYASAGSFTGSITSADAHIGDTSKYLDFDGTDLTIEAGNMSVDSTGNLTATNVDLSGTITASDGTIGGFNIASARLYSGEVAGTGARVQLDATENRFAIYDASNNLKVALGYLDNVESYTGTQYGLYIADGNTVRFEGGGELVGNDYTIASDGAVVIDDGSDGELARFGSLSGGGLGLVIGDPDSDEGLKYTIADGLIIHGGLQSQFADFSGELTVGYETAGTGDIDDPEDGDRRVYIDGDEIGFQEYTNAGWSSVNQVKFGGVDSNDNFSPFLACRGILNPLADKLSGEVFPGSDFHLLTLESDYADQHGLSPDSTTNCARSSAWSKSGSYSLFATSTNVGELVYNDVVGYEYNMGYGAWIKAQSIGIAVQLFYAEYYIDADNYYSYQIIWQSTGNKMEARFFEEVDGASVQNTSASIEITSTALMTGEHFVYGGIDFDSNEIYLGLDGEIDTGTIDDLTLTEGTPSSATAYIYAANEFIDPFGGTITHYQDNIVFSFSDTCSADVFTQYYNHDVEWNTDYTTEDIYLKPGSNGKVIIGDASDENDNPWGIESGSDANGYFTKFPDGTLIQWLPDDDGGYNLRTWTFPCPFIDTNYALSSSVDSPDYIRTACVDTRLTGSVQYYARSETNGASAIDLILTAIGRWK